LTESPPIARWHAAGAHAVACHRWGDDVVVYVHATGATHWLDAEGASAYLALRAVPEGVTSAALATLPGWPTHAQEILGELEALGLVRCADGAPT
jgi:hypothetical protein